MLQSVFSSEKPFQSFRSCQSCAHLLRRDLVGLRPHVNLLVDVHTRDDEEHARPPGAARQQPAQPEDDGSLVLLDHLDGEEEGEGEGAEDDEDAGDGEKK